MYKIKRFSSDNDNRGMSTTGKVLTGAAVIGGGLLAGRAGLLGKGVKNFLKGGVKSAPNITQSASSTANQVTGAVQKPQNLLSNGTYVKTDKSGSIITKNADGQFMKDGVAFKSDYSLNIGRFL